jgi:hypothetical protein
MAMDPVEARPRFWSPLALSAAHRWDWLAIATLCVPVLLLGARLIWRVPKPLLLTLGLVYLVCALVLGALWRSGAPARATRAAALLALWACASGLALTALYRVDRAGWLWLVLTGYDSVWAEDLTEHVDRPLAAFLDDHPMFEIDRADPVHLVLRRGSYEIDRSVLVPRGTRLTIEPGTRLEFAAGRSLISYGPLVARGTADEPIRFTARSPWLKWGVVAVVGADPSVFEHVRFEHGRRARVNQVEMPGALSLIDSDAEIQHAEFRNSFGKDAVYVRGGSVVVKESLFENAYKDGLDLDDGRAQISANRFVDCDDEAIDLSGDYHVEIFGNEILDARGGRVAAGQDLDAIRARNSFGYSQRSGARP